jgi:hypothetical protein
LETFLGLAVSIVLADLNSGSLGIVPGGLKLASLEDKMKALFLKNLTIQSIDGIATQRTDYLLESRQSLNLTRNLRELSKT